MICPKCHKEIPDGSKFCLECGSTVSGESAEAFDGSVGDGVTVEPDRPAPAPSIGGDETIQARVGDGSPGIMTGTRLTDRYEPGEEIGSGGFARVFVARDRKLGRTVAVKRLRPEHVGGKAGTRTVERFVRESQAIAGLNHRNIVQVFDADRDPDGYYIVMEYVDGGTLRDHLKAQGTLDLAEALPLFRGVAQGLAYAHRHNLVHRDMKPANILLGRDDGELVPKIVDFGLARAGADSDLSMTGYGMGTPFYMPPEQRRDAKGVNHTADIYALGKILYEMVSGEIPDNVDPEAIPPPPELAQIIFRAIKSRPEERYFSVEDLLRDLDALSATDAAPSNTGTGRSDSTGNPCPSCGASNPPDGKFCEQCGTGLTRVCPECERENSIHKRFCAGCGTDVEGFVQVQEILGNMEHHAKQSRWSRVLKEYEELPADPQLPGNKGTEILSEITRLRTAAADTLEASERLRVEINVAESEERFREALDKLDEYQKWAPKSQKVQQQQRQRLEEKLEGQDWDFAFISAQNALDQNDFVAARVAFEQFAENYPDSEQTEYARSLSELRLPTLEAYESLKVAVSKRYYKPMVDAASELLEAIERLPEQNKPIIEGRPTPQDMKKLVARAYAKAGLAYVNRSTFSSLSRIFVVPMHEIGGMLTKRFDFQRAERCAEYIANLGGFDKKAHELRERIATARRDICRQRRWAAAICVLLLLLFFLAWAGISQHRQTVFRNAIGDYDQAIEEQQWDAAEDALTVASGIPGYEDSRNVAQRTHRLELHQAIEAAEAAEIRGEWNLVASIVEEGRDHLAKAGPNVASAKQRLLDLASEANAHLYSKLTIVAIIDGGEVKGATVELNGNAHQSPHTFTIEKGKRYEFKVSAAERNGTRYWFASLAVTADWTGKQTKRVTLEEITDPTAINVLGMAFVEIAPGSFKMGSNDGDSDEKPIHDVRISYRFWMGKYEVTNGQYKQFLQESKYDGNDDADSDYLARFRGNSNMPTASNHPICWVSWKNAAAFCKWLTERERRAGRLPDGYVYRLPTEAEWEYAARAGSKSQGYKYAGSDNADEVAWYYENAGDQRLDDANWDSDSALSNNNRTHEVGTKKANELGLHDMSGNVWEWCYDWYDEDYYGKSPGTNPVNTAASSSRVFRGGSWFIPSGGVRSADRSWVSPRFTTDFLGFRVCLAPQIREQ